MVVYVLQPANLVASRKAVVTRGKVSVGFSVRGLLKERAKPIRKDVCCWSTCTVKIAETAWKESYERKCL